MHLQQLTHMPSRDVDDTRESVDFYLEQLLRIGLPHSILIAILRSVRERLVSTYDQRIAAAPAESRQRLRLERYKEQAIRIFWQVLPQVEARLREEGSE